MADPDDGGGDGYITEGENDDSPDRQNHCLSHRPLKAMVRYDD